jgi:hypothetical protein
LQEDKLKQERMALDALKQEQDQRDQKLGTQEMANRSKEDELEQERVALDVLKQEQDQREQELNAQKATNQSKQDELDRKQLAPRQQKQKLLAEQQELRLAQESKERRAEKSLHSTQDPQPPQQHPEQESRRPLKRGGEVVPVQPPEQYPLGPVRPGSVRSGQESSMIPERPGEMNSQWSGDSRTNPPNGESEMVAPQGDIQMDELALKKPRRITQIGMQSSEGSTGTEQGTSTQLRRHYHVLEEQKPEQQNPAESTHGRPQKEQEISYWLERDDLRHPRQEQGTKTDQVKRKRRGEALPSWMKKPRFLESSEEEEQEHQPWPDN